MLPGSADVSRTCHRYPAGATVVLIPAARLRDQVQGAAQGDRGHALAPVSPVDEEAGQPVVGKLVELGVVLLAVVDVRQLLRSAVLAPRGRTRSRWSPTGPCVKRAHGTLSLRRCRNRPWLAAAHGQWASALVGVVGGGLKEADVDVVLVVGGIAA